MSSSEMATMNIKEKHLGKGEGCSRDPTASGPDALSHERHNVGLWAHVSNPLNFSTSSPGAVINKPTNASNIVINFN